MQTCGMLRSTAGGPTLAHVDVELQKNAIGRGRVGHREVSGLIFPYDSAVVSVGSTGCTALEPAVALHL